MSTAAEDQGWTREPAHVASASRFCDLCDVWTDHFADAHEDTTDPGPEFVAAVLAESRSRLRRTP